MKRHQTPKASPQPLPIPSFHRNAGSTSNWFPGGGFPNVVTLTGFSVYGPLNVPRWPLAVVNAPWKNCVIRTSWVGAAVGTGPLGQSAIAQPL